MLAGLALKFIVIISVVSCQIDGEFWWLKNDISKLKQGTAPPPQFDDINELDTDETAKVVFKEKDLNVTKSERSLNDKYSASAIYFQDKTELSKLFYDKFQMNSTNNLPQKTAPKILDKDEFRFIFPSDNNLLLTNDKKIQKQSKTSPEDNKVVDDNIQPIQPHSQSSPEENNPLNPENICTFIKKLECIRNEGSLYVPRMDPNMHMKISNTQVICCILPITTTAIAKIVFPDAYWSAKRHKRSNTEGINPALQQRNTLMSRKYTPNNQVVRTTTPATRRKINRKVVNSNEYSGDPYWNIKNPIIRNPDVPTYQDPDSGYDYGSQSYGDVYTDEVPRPGLLGTYSNHKQTQSSWTHNKNKGFYHDESDSVEEEDLETSFGYSTIDPRKDQRQKTASSKPLRRRPMKLTETSSKDPMHNSQSQTISFHSNPDFQVLQGFKLLNLERRKNRFVRKTPERSKECDNGSKEMEKPSKLINFFEDNNENYLSATTDFEYKLFNKCGKTLKVHGDCNNGQDLGDVEFGDHPWIALVVMTKGERVILCYATLIHSRVAVSAADCVYGKSPGEVSVVAGVRNLEEDLAGSQRRMVTVILDPEYTPGNLGLNLALLHWIRPLIFHAAVQPACLAEPKADDSCVFVGWGGYDQESYSALRWQRASIIAPQECKRLSKLYENDALCAAVQSTSTVTGVGGPLLCRSEGQWSAVAVAVWRDQIVLLLPARDWVLRHMAALGIR